MSERPILAGNAANTKRRALLAMLGGLPLGAAASATPSLRASPLAVAIARRYRVEPSAVERVIALAEKHFPADPTLLLAIVGVESAWRPWAVGQAGEVGLCQVRPDLHGASATALADPGVNIRTAGRVLRQCLSRARGDVGAAVARYNGRGAPAEEYAARVLTEREILAAMIEGWTF
ncbi:MAG TPA: lytic transglycosylase domain-containing protein [Burkholderiales bacterium]|nr:lytic transglycosylase domain-containing protein [Burkholderiales bacterium]